MERDSFLYKARRQCQVIAHKIMPDDYAPMDIEELPPFFNQMKEAARVLCQDFPFVRVDFFLANNTYYFAELTFTPSGGMMPFNPDKYDLEWGQMMDVSDVIRRRTWGRLSEN